MPSAEAIQIAKRAALEMGPISLGPTQDDPRGNIPPANGPEDFDLSADTDRGADELVVDAPTVAAQSGRGTPLKLTYFDDCGKTALRRWILKGIIARNETSGWVAPPGAGKSALLTEIAIHCAARVDWRATGRKRPAAWWFLRLSAATCSSAGWTITASATTYTACRSQWSTWWSTCSIRLALKSSWRRCARRNSDSAAAPGC